MRPWEYRNRRFRFALVELVLIALVHAFPVLTYAQNLGQPTTGQAVQGQTAAQPEGTVLNMANRVGNVIFFAGKRISREKLRPDVWTQTSNRAGQKIAHKAVPPGAGVVSWLNAETTGVPTLLTFCKSISIE